MPVLFCPKQRKHASSSSSNRTHHGTRLRASYTALRVQRWSENSLGNFCCENRQYSLSPTEYYITCQPTLQAKMNYDDFCCLPLLRCHFFLCRWPHFHHRRSFPGVPSGQVWGCGNKGQRPVRRLRSGKNILHSVREDATTRCVSGVSASRAWTLVFGGTDVAIF